jgi:hypothetical protein
MTPQVPDTYADKRLRKDTDKKQNILEVFEKAKLLAQKFKGECISQSFSICKGKNSLKFKCPNSHTFFVAVDLIESIQTRISSVT